MDHVTGACFRPKSKPAWSWWYSPGEFDAKEAPQAAKHTISEFLDPKLLGKAIYIGKAISRPLPVSKLGVKVPFFQV